VSKTITLEGDITAANTATSLTAQGSITSPSRVTPSGVSRIKKIIVAVAPDMAAAGAAVFFLRIGGDAVRAGEQNIIVGAAGGQLPQTGADPTGIAPFTYELDNVDIAVDPTEVIRVQAEMAGDDLGTARVVVTLIFE